MELLSDFPELKESGQGKALSGRCPEISERRIVEVLGSYNLLGRRWNPTVIMVVGVNGMVDHKPRKLCHRFGNGSEVILGATDNFKRRH